MPLELFRRRTLAPLASIRHAVMVSMKSTGDKECDCQRLTIVNRLDALERALESVAADDLIPHIIFGEPIACAHDAERLIRYLYSHDLAFHPDDDPSDLADRCFTSAEASLLCQRMDEIRGIASFDPCALYLRLHHENQPEHSIHS